MHRRLCALLLAFAAVACSDTVTAPIAPADSAVATALGDPPRQITVTSADDSGPGTLRAALEEASADQAVVGITFEWWVRTITPTTTLTFSGPQALTIDGGLTTTVYGFLCNCDVFEMRVRSSIRFRGIVIAESRGTGVRVVVPEDATGTVRVTLDTVNFTGHARHALLVNDQPQYLIDETSTATTGSAASVRVEINGAHFGQNGLSGWNYDHSPRPAFPDQDGIRVNEGGDGNAVVILSGLQMVGNGGDAIHVDERGKGSIDFRLESSTVTENGSASVEDRHDGVHLEESGAGDLKSYVYDVAAVLNAEQAFDYSESGTGNLSATFVLVNVSYHNDNAVVLTEDAVGTGGGNLILDLSDSQLGGNGWDPLATGVRGTANLFVHEKGAGSLTSRVTRTAIDGSQYGGMVHREDSGGNLSATISASSFSSNAHFGLIFDENGAGNLVAGMSGGSVSYNGGIGIQAEQAPTGFGTLTLAAVNLLGNGGGANNVQVVSGQVSVVITP